MRSNISCSFRARCLWSCTQLTAGSNVFFSVHLSFPVSFPKLTIFAILCLYVACKMRKITALTWEISSWRLVEKFHISAFPMHYSLYNWIGEHEITKLKKIYLRRIQKKGHKNKYKKTWHGMTQNGLFDIFSNAHAPSILHHTVWKQQELNEGCEPWNECLF